jgi:hypothetical protein
MNMSFMEESFCLGLVAICDFCLSQAGRPSQDGPESKLFHMWRKCRLLHTWFIAGQSILARMGQGRSWKINCSVCGGNVDSAIHGGNLGLGFGPNLLS